MNALGKTVVVAGTILAIGALTRHPITSSGVVADPPLPREREWVLHTPAYDQEVDLYPFSQREVCRATLATMNSRDPLAYQETPREAGDMVRVRPAERPQAVHLGLPHRAGPGAHQARRVALEREQPVFLRSIPGHLQIEQWLMPGGEKLELLELRTFIKAQVDK